MPEQIPPAAPAEVLKTGAWSLRDIKLPPDEMLAAIAAAPSVPQEDKDYLIAKITKYASKPRFLRLDVHSSFSPESGLVHSLSLVKF